MILVFLEEIYLQIPPTNKTWSATTLEVDDRDEEDYVRVNSFIDHHAAETSVSKATDGALPQVDDSDADVIEVEDVVVHSSASPPSVIPPPPRSRSGRLNWSALMLQRHHRQSALQHRRRKRTKMKTSWIKSSMFLLTGIQQPSEYDTNIFSIVTIRRTTGILPRTCRLTFVLTGCTKKAMPIR